MGLGDGVASYVLLPAGILSNLDEVTIEAWASCNVTASNNFENLFAFGNTDSRCLGTPITGLGGNAITLSPHTGGATTSLNFAQGLPGFNGERDAVLNNVLDWADSIHIVAVYHPYAGYEALYTNGVLAATISMFNNMIYPKLALMVRSIPIGVFWPTPSGRTRSMALGIALLQ